MAVAMDSLSEEYENWLRLTILVDFSGRNLCHNVLFAQEKLPTDGKLLYKELENLSCPFTDQRKIMCPSNGITNCDNFDVTLYTRIIKGKFGNKYDSLVNDLRNARNKLFHTGKKEIPDKEFNKLWKDTTDILQKHNFDLALVDGLKTSDIFSHKQFRSIATFFHKEVIINTKKEIEGVKKDTEYIRGNMEDIGRGICKKIDESVTLIGKQVTQEVIINMKKEIEGVKKDAEYTRGNMEDIGRGICKKIDESVTLIGKQVTQAIKSYPDVLVTDSGGILEGPQDSEDQEDVIHISKISDYQLFAHNARAKEISDAIHEILKTKETNINIKLNPNNEYNVENINFNKQCVTYFEENFESLAKEAPIILPCKEPEKFKEIVKTLESWCRKTNKSSKIKGLVLHSFSVFRQLEHFGFKKEAFQRSLKIRAFSEEPVTIAHNPQENVLLLIRIAKHRDLETDVKLGLDDLKMFILLCNYELKGSNMKLISLVVTGKEHNFQSKCVNCVNNVLPLETFKDLPTFENWYENKATYFETESVENINANFIKFFVAKITGAVAATFIYGEYMPTLTVNSYQKMKNLSVLLTRQQMEILYSQHKYVIIKGGFGCGKTVIAAAMLKKISESLRNNEKLYYVCYDSRSELLSQITKDVQKKTDTNITPYHNVERRNLSEIIGDILQQHESTKKINFVVDEYDGEDLDESEANRLNKVFNESLKQSFIALIVQPIEKERIIYNTHQSKNRFDLLKNMELHQLNLVMRNSVEIHNLIKVTMDLLQKQKTVFIHHKTNKTKSEVKMDIPMSRNNAVNELSKPGSDIYTELPSRKKESQEENQKERSSILKLGLDEAQAVTKSVLKKDDRVATNVLHGAAEFFRAGRRVGENKTITKFLYAAVDKTGHKISTKKPVLCEVEGKSGFQKIISLIAIFEERQIKKGEHVVLHFDTATNAIPEIFLFAFAHHFKMQDKITNNYKAFKSRERSILVCSYLTFRGLEHPKITVVLDRDIYYVQHYLVEALARCTTDLCIVVLKNSSNLKKITAEWKSKQVIEQWNVKISEDAAEKESFKAELKSTKNRITINAKFNFEYYNKLEKQFGQLVTEDKIVQYKDDFEAKKTLQQSLAFAKGREINRELVSSFTLAAYIGNVRKVVYMVEAGMPVDIGNKHDDTALIEAARNNRTDVVLSLLEKGANVDKQGRYGFTALHHASRHNYTDVISVLLKHGASRDIKDKDGRTPIDCAREEDYKEAVHLLQQY